MGQRQRNCCWKEFYHWREGPSKSIAIHDSKPWKDSQFGHYSRVVFFVNDVMTLLRFLRGRKRESIDKEVKIGASNLVNNEAYLLPTGPFRASSRAEAERLVVLLEMTSGEMRVLR